MFYIIRVWMLSSLKSMPVANQNIQTITFILRMGRPFIK